MFETEPFDLFHITVFFTKRMLCIEFTTRLDFYSDYAKDMLTCIYTPIHTRTIHTMYTVFVLYPYSGVVCYCGRSHHYGYEATSIYSEETHAVRKFHTFGSSRQRGFTSIVSVRKRGYGRALK